jgi:flagellar hook-associated protein 3 FlgL
MDTAYTSTKALNDGARLSILKLQHELTVAQQEVSSGRLADVGLSLGGRTSETISLRAQLAQYQTITDANASVKTRIDSTQAAMSSFVTTAQKFITTLLAARSANNGQGLAQNEAKANLTALIDGLNTAVGSEYIFGGINSSVKPVTNYYGTPTPANQAAVASAFTAAFGTTQSDPANDQITAASMQSFLDGAFSNLFADPAWSADWSKASSENITSRISATEDVEGSANANEPGFRELAKAYTMVADLGTQTLNRNTFDTIVDSAVKLVGQAIQDIATTQARLGTSSARVEASNQHMSLQVNVITAQIDNLEKVDPFEASTKVTTLMTQLQTSYSMTARIMNLTILNYL